MAEGQVVGGYCETCRYWGGIRPAWNTHTLRTCGAPQVAYGYDVQAAMAIAEVALIENHQGWGMLTGPRFGCVHWAAPGVHAAPPVEPAAPGEEAIPHAEAPPAV